MGSIPVRSRGLAVSMSARQWYDEWTGDEGTNPKITEAEFSTANTTTRTGLGMARFGCRPKTMRNLNALAVPPSGPFEVTVDVSMNNDEYRTIEDKIVFETD